MHVAPAATSVSQALRLTPSLAERNQREAPTQATALRAANITAARKAAAERSVSP
jgi:hypothetical protein